MAKVTITHMKAPWPEGAKVGDVVAFDGEVPAWAVGKCTPASDDAEAVNVEAHSGGGAALDRAALEAEAAALGVQFRSNISDETLAARIAEAKAAK